MELRPRHIRADVEDALRTARAVAIVGPRQSGKSTLASIIARDVLETSLVTLDDDTARSFAQQDPAGFIASLPLPAVLDEVQRAPGIMLAIKQIVDRDTRPGRFLLTGSADLRVLPTIPDALPGRVEYLNLWPFSQGELVGHREHIIDELHAGEPPRVEASPVGMAALADRIVTGGFPASIGLTNRRRAGFFESYVTSLLGGAIADVSDARRPEIVPPLMQLLGARSGSLLNLRGLSMELGIDAKTVDAYVRLLERLGLVLIVPAWHTNLGHRVIKTPKVHVADSGLHAYLVGADSQALIRSPELAGRLVETFVLNEIVRQSGWADHPPVVHHYRGHAGDEVDIVLSWRDGTVAGIEVKSASSIGPRDTRGLTRLREALGERFTLGLVLYTGERTVPAGRKIWAMPIEGLWRAGNGR